MALWSTAWCFTFIYLGQIAVNGGSAPVPTRMIGYFDAKSQKSLPVFDIPHDDLTHIVLINAMTVDKLGKLHMLPHKAKYGNASGEELIAHLAKQPNKMVVGLRGFPDDVAFDQLAEKVERREQFVNDMVTRLSDWGASGLEIEWHAEDIAGDKAHNAPFDEQERDHIALLVRALSNELRARGLTMSMAVRPGRQEFTSAAYVRDYLDWLAVRAFSMRSLGDPHHSSLKDMAVALGEWTLQGVPPAQLVLATPLFARPGAALRQNSRDDALRRSWHEIVSGGVPGKPETQHTPANDDMRSDVFVDQASGKAWWMSGLETTAAKLRELLVGGYGGLAFRDLHHDAKDPDLSIVKSASEALATHREAELEAQRKRLEIAPSLSLLQRGKRLQRSSGSAGAHDEF